MKKIIIMIATLISISLSTRAQYTVDVVNSSNCNIDATIYYIDAAVCTLANTTATFRILPGNNHLDIFNTSLTNVEFYVKIANTASGACALSDFMELGEATSCPGFTYPAIDSYTISTGCSPNVGCAVSTTVNGTSSTGGSPWTVTVN